MSDDGLEYEVIFEPLPVRFEKPVLLLPGLMVLGGLAKGISQACTLMIDSINAHLAFEHDMNEFQAAAAVEIETLMEGTDG